jgi:hypothetical protein
VAIVPEGIVVVVKSVVEVLETGIVELVEVVGEVVGGV